VPKISRGTSGVTRLVESKGRSMTASGFTASLRWTSASFGELCRAAVKISVARVALAALLAAGFLME